MILRGMSSYCRHCSTVTEVNAALVVHVLNAVSFTMELSLSEKLQQYP